MRTSVCRGTVSGSVPLHLDDAALAEREAHLRVVAPKRDATSRPFSQATWRWPMCPIVRRVPRLVPTPLTE